jgi:hypothetical protein
MRIIKYSEFIKEEFNDTPEQYIEVALNKIKKRIEKMFDYEDLEEDPDRVIKLDDVRKKDEEEKKVSFSDLGLRLESSEISKYSELYDSLTVKFTDDLATYNLWIMIELKEGISKDPNKDFSNGDVKKCFIKFKKYDKVTFDVIGQITKTVEIDKLDEDFLVDLKIELDEEFGDEGDELEINT